MSETIFGVMTVADLVQWLIHPHEYDYFAALSPTRQLYVLSNKAHEKRQYNVRDACNKAAYALLAHDNQEPGGEAEPSPATLRPKNAAVEE